MKEITKIVITGGPCAGKTTALSWIQNAFTAKGYKVLFVPETATELISGGVAPWTCGTNEDYQHCQMRLQLDKEQVFRRAADTMPDERILIVCDRGAMDNKAYMTEEEFARVIAGVGKTEVQLRDDYDGIFHLNTAAKGAEEFYTLSNNGARIETPAQARALDDKLIAAWTGHPHLRVIGNDVDFDEKMKNLIGEIASLLGEPQPMAVDRKYLIEYPDIAWLESQPNCRRVEISQTYLKTENGDEVRVRQRGEKGHYIFYQTIKRRINDLKRIEMERRLTNNEYVNLLMDADPSLHPIRKTRYCLTWMSQYFEIDVYPFWSDKAIMELEVRDERQEVVLPPFIKVIREVTGDPAYRNRAIAAMPLK